MLIRNLKATGDCGVSIGVLGAFKGLTQPAFVGWPVEAELNREGKAIRLQFWTSVEASPCSDSAPRLWIAGGH
jgi:hypothetical protein